MSYALAPEMPRTRAGRFAIAAVLVVSGVAAFGSWVAWRAWRGGSGRAAATAASLAGAQYVGRAACADCHETETALWKGSDHDLAMQVPDEKTVLGDFSGSTYEHFGVTSTFTRRDGKYFVTTDGPDGKPAEFEVAYTFGVHPLQQYLLRMPQGRLQALNVCWDTRTREQGGQRWFHLYPDEAIPAGDVLHWTGPAQNWNHMCAECHSTNVHKGWIPAESRFETTFSELDVSCEACHGPASAHVTWARDHGASRGSGGVPKLTAAEMGLVADLTEPPSAWIPDPKTGIAHRERPRQSKAEIETCARCHARRALLFEDYRAGQPLLQTHEPALLDALLYHADGQQMDEDYEYGSFLQSRMYASGVSCGDCHEVHGVRRPSDPDRVCFICHLPARFDSPDHHHHENGTQGASCVECHMPSKNYMVVDGRRDHSFRVPRPDLTLKIGTPNACSGCHADKDARWANDAVAKWYPHGRSTTPHYGEALQAGRRGMPGAEVSLAQLVDDPLQPAIARASALELLGDLLGPSSLATLERALGDEDGLVRAAAVDALGALPPAVRVGLESPLLADPLRVVRIETASALAADAKQIPADLRPIFDKALAEYRAAQATNADRPEAHANLGSLELRLGNRAAARREYEEGLRLGPWFTGLWVNLADLLREEGDDAEGERVLRRGLEVAASKTDLHHALGLNLARQKRLDEALPELESATNLAPENVRFAYVYGVALLSSGKPRDALAIFARALEHRPGDRGVLSALASVHRDLGELQRAREYARRLVEAAPEDPEARRLLEELEAGR
jgi:tetratricopeptide (TPR) repeat protein